jgi:hypothetical protein
LRLELRAWRHCRSDSRNTGRQLWRRIGLLGLLIPSACRASRLASSKDRRRPPLKTTDLISGRPHGAACRRYRTHLVTRGTAA